MFKRKQRGVHSYPVIKITSKSRVLISQLFGIVSKVGFTCHTYYDEGKICPSGKISLTHHLVVSGSKSIELWMSKIGSKSPIQMSKYLIWKKFGFCPPHTTLAVRRSILDDKTDPLIFEKCRG